MPLGADSEVTIDTGCGKTISAVVTREGADEAGATTGAQVLAIFRPPMSFSQVIEARSECLNDHADSAARRLSFRSARPYLVLGR
jgi:hypothetical protein